MAPPGETIFVSKYLLYVLHLFDLAYLAHLLNLFNLFDLAHLTDLAQLPLKRFPGGPFVLGGEIERVPEVGFAVVLLVLVTRVGALCLAPVAGLWTLANPLPAAGAADLSR